MANSPRAPHSSGEYPGAPRWVKVLGIILLALILLLVLLRLTGIGGDHGPGRHMPFGEAAGQTAPSGASVSTARSQAVPERGN